MIGKMLSGIIRSAIKSEMGDMREHMRSLMESVSDLSREVEELRKDIDFMDIPDAYDIASRIDISDMKIPTAEEISSELEFEFNMLMFKIDAIEELLKEKFGLESVET